MKYSESPLVLVDFDGTIAQNDVGALLFKTFSKEESRKIVSLWLKGEINSKECLQRECELTRISRSELRKFALSQKIDGKFPAFVDLCNREKMSLAILSDGLDFYIELILRKYGLGKLPFFSNLLRFEGRKLKPEFPYFDRGCGRCGNCKRFHLKNLKRTKQKVVYIGDGLSDKCAVTEADFVFAKDDLRRFCEKEDIKHYPFHNFGDIIQTFGHRILDRRRSIASSGEGARGA
ncbi:MAG: MtnX-like HAD-IB family phosphatase [Candidatus Zixiibacteriota bacterium]|nr:MAG: MtnX-like HAD-IB family phosphatase [candidate division Zixibacteria bacterium]